MQVKSVVVVGAGLAGLGAARALQAAGITATVLEGRGRLGGRVWTENGIDLGAHWIHGTDGNPITSACRELSVPTVFVGGDSSYTGGWEDLLLHKKGVVLSPERKEASIALMDDVHDAMDALRRKTLLDGGADMSLLAAARQVLGEMTPDPSLALDIDWHLELVARDDAGAGAENMSLLHWDEGYEVYGPGDSLIAGGAGALVEKMAEGLTIHLDTPVDRIHHDEHGVTVFAPSRSWRADAAIVTVPLGVLKAGTIAFDPPLPRRKQQAIARLAVGSMSKIILTFDKPFWPENQYVFGSLPLTREFGPTTIVNMWKSHRKPILIMLFGGEPGRRLEAMGTNKSADVAEAVLRNVFGPDAPKPKAMRLTNWQSDPFSRGAYVYLPPGVTSAEMDVMAEPVGERLLFAGEHTMRIHWATMQSGLHSGLREAVRITGNAGILPNRRFTETRRWREQLKRAERLFNSANKLVTAAEVQARMDMMQRSPVFETIPVGDLRVLAAIFERLDLAGGHVLVRAGDPADSVYAVMSGALEVLLPGMDRPIAVKGPGDVAGEYGLFLPQRSATLRAAEPTSVLRLDYGKFRKFLMVFPESMMVLFGQVVKQNTPRAADGHLESHDRR